MFCPSIQCPAIEYSFSARGCLEELGRVLGLGKPFLGELKLVLKLVKGFLQELKLVLKIVFFCLLVQQPCSQGCKAESSSTSFEVSVAAHALLRGLQYAAIADALLLPRRWPLIPEAPTGSHYWFEAPL